MLSYWFYPNPGAVSYENPKIIALIAVSLLLFLSSFALAYWRRRLQNPVTRRLTKSWGSVLRWFSGVGVLLTISRVEGVQFLSIRFLWLLWVLALLAFILFQAWKFRLRHYTILPHVFEEDPREKYLPKAKKA